MRKRVTVTLRDDDTESAHGERVFFGDQYVTLSWTDGSETLIPWTAILRIDTENCRCHSCLEEQAT